MQRVVAHLLSSSMSNINNVASTTATIDGNGSNSASASASANGGVEEVSQVGGGGVASGNK